VTASHVNISEDLTIRDRIVRRMLCARLARAPVHAANLDLARWRQHDWVPACRSPGISVERQ
jgi:hypothetical protein